MPRAEPLLILLKEGIDPFTIHEFPIPIKDFGVDRLLAHDMGLCHISVLIIPFLASDDNQILTINKNRRDVAINELLIKTKKLKTENTIPPLCLDIFGGHCHFSNLTESEKEGGYLSFDTIYREAVRELKEELIYDPSQNSPAAFFGYSDLVYLGLYPISEAKNTELSIAFGILLDRPASDYKAQDDFVDENGNVEQIPLETGSYYYEHIKRISEEQPEEIFIHDGLGRIIKRGNLPEIVSKTKFPVRSYTSINIKEHQCIPNSECKCIICNRIAHHWKVSTAIEKEIGERFGVAECSVCGEYGNEFHVEQ